DDVKKAEWGWWVEVKQNALDALLRQSRKITGSTVFLGSATDPYQPIELRVGLTRAILEALLFAFPARLHIQTRSPFIVRDIELLNRFEDTLPLGASLPPDSGVARRVFDPRARATPRRTDAARQLKDAGTRPTASIAPLLPCTPKRLAALLAPDVHGAWV